MVSAAGALGTSGRMVPVSASGYLVYGDDRGRPGNITEATSFNYYTGSIDYVGFIPDTSTPTRYSLDSPYGSYYATQTGLEPITGAPINLNVVASRSLEGDAPTVRDVGRTVEVDVGVGDKVLVQLDDAGFSDVVAFSVDAEGVVAKVVTSPNDLIATEYRDFNGTGKFVFFEGEAQVEPNDLRRYGLESCHRSTKTCGAGSPPYVVYSSSSYFVRYDLYADNQRAAAPLTIDAHVSNVAESLSDSEASLAARYGYVSYSSPTYTSGIGTIRLNGGYNGTTFSDGLWHVTSLLTETEYPLGSATFFKAASGTYRVTDATPYVVHSDVGPLDSKTVRFVPNSSVYVLLEDGGDQTYTVSNMDASLSTTTPQAYPASPGVTSGNAPRLASIERYSPSNDTTDNPALTYKMTFNEDVTGVDAADFALSPNSTGVTISSNPVMSTFTDTITPPHHSAYISYESALDVPYRGSATSVSVHVDISHLYIGELRVSLVTPDGTVMRLHDRTGGSTDNIDQTYTLTMDDESIHGEWKLQTYDFTPNSYRTTLNSWTLTINDDIYQEGEPVSSIYGSGNTYYATYGLRSPNMRS